MSQTPVDEARWSRPRSQPLDLWSFGEDTLADQMLGFDDKRMLALWRTAEEYYDEDFPLPVTGRNITLGHVVAFACMWHLEGQLRPLDRQRRRPAKTTPEHLIEAQSIKNDELDHLHHRLVRDS